MKDGSQEVYVLSEQHLQQLEALIGQLQHWFLNIYSNRGLTVGDGQQEDQQD